MTDFFMRMAQRAIGAAPAIQPVVVSRHARLNPVAPSPHESEVDVVGNTGAQMNDVGKRPSVSASVPSSSPPLAMTERVSEFEPKADLSLADLETTRPTLGHELEPQIPGAFSELPADPKDSPTGDRIRSARSTDSPVQTVRAVFSSMSESDSLPVAGSVISRPPRANIDGVETSATGSEESDRSQDHGSALKPESIFQGNDEARRLPGEPELTSPALERGAANSAESFPLGFQPNSEQSFVLRAEQSFPSRAEESFAPRSEESFAPRAQQSFPSRSEESFAPRAQPSFPSQPEQSFAPRAEQSFASRAEFEEKNPSVIRVTIGRIEVRATTPAPPQRQEAGPASPKISLDEFLRQHNGRLR